MTKKLLIVEDDTFFREIYKTKFKEHGEVEVKFAEDGEVALTILKTFKPHAILLDIVMPKKDGLTVLEEIKKKPRTKRYSCSYGIQP